eukprot:TRINITY_DN130_c0_g1_i3.p1 TRINITY_DN130_c0_g1~~TRINITY_DN130_c0_g1_i3.p1  ORF type:complete len:251 (-),score=51.34 TRINITY_DN130_c0_g1_i3:41-793(-)
MCCIVRTAFFLLIPYWAPEDFFMSNFHHILFTILDDLPGMLYFTTYTLLILFWAEIIYMANTQATSSSKYRTTFALTNGFVYVCQLIIWLLLVLVPGSVEDVNYVDHAFFGVISLLAALAFCVYGGKLYNMLSNFPIDTKNRRNRLKEVFVSTIVCTTCFTIRATYIGLSILQEGMDLNFLFVGSFYILVEIIPSAVILWILRKLPPAKRGGRSNRSSRDKENMFASNDSEPTSSLLGKPAGLNDGRDDE